MKVKNMSNCHILKNLKRHQKYLLFAIIELLRYNHILKDDLEFHLWLDFYC